VKCISEDGSAAVGSLIAYETMIHDETRGIIQEGDTVNCAGASGCLIWNLHLMEIGVPQVIHISRGESVNVNTARSIFLASQSVQYLVDGVTTRPLTWQRDQLCGVSVAGRNTLELALLPDAFSD
jgi:hypothetical protein